ncbi:sensor histidine kinase [Miniphocaeibacter massiliensis]|uniref:sensor histidine kinase n=1 Tax=Miniphocaeibacter massiliensis TaxID=2041841 RepID=UPI000C1C3C84|nr:HAMP domain-containing sensor histidine kinase [Miniphocaeibacter massiliensis]
MKLNRKTFIYSIVLSFIILALFLSYMLLMLPSLYVEHSKRENLNEVIDLHNFYIENKEYRNGENIKTINSISMYIEKNKYNMHLSNHFFNGEIEIVDNSLKSEIEKIRKNFEKENFKIDKVLSSESKKKLENIFSNNLFKKAEEELNKYAKIKFNTTDFAKDYSNINEYNGETKIYGDNTFIFIAKAKDKSNTYTSYILLTNEDGNIYISFSSILTPLIADIQAPIYSSIPMIILIILLFSIVISRYFSNKIVNPILEISRHVENNKGLKTSEIKSLDIKTGDEIEQLSKRLNELYEVLRNNYNELEAESKRKEVFMRSSSHQLKTPISGALLLVNGMIDKVGKYANRDVYLPEVKRQILDMNNIVSEILKLNHILENINIEEINIKNLLNIITEKHSAIVEDKEITLKIEEFDISLKTDYELTYKIFDNLINNAVKHSSRGATVKIGLREKGVVQILNTNSKIPEEIEKDIFEPFVSSHDEKGNGLGLYLVSYYASILKYKVSVKNIENGVLAEVFLKQP